MRDEEDRHVDSLLGSYGRLEREILKVDLRQVNEKENRERIEKSVSELTTEVRTGFKAVNKKIDDQTAANKWTPAQYALILVAAISGLTSVLAVVLTRAPG
jgi:hypothetical protein